MYVGGTYVVKQQLIELFLFLEAKCWSTFFTTLQLCEDFMKKYRFQKPDLHSFEGEEGESKFQKNGIG